MSQPYRPLSPGQTVMYNGNPEDLGTVTITRRTGCYITWDNAGMQWHDYNDPHVKSIRGWLTWA